MDEGCAGTRIEADAATLQPQARFAHGFQPHIRDEEVDRLAAHMLAGLGDAAGTAAEHGVGGGRPVAADDVDMVFRADLPMDLPEGVDQVGVHGGGFAGAPVAQRPVDLLHRLRVVPAFHLIGDGRVFLEVDVVEGDGAGIAIGGRVLQRFAAEEHKKSGNTAARPGTEGL